MTSYIMYDILKLCVFGIGKFSDGPKYLSGRGGGSALLRLCLGSFAPLKNISPFSPCRNQAIH